MSPSKLHRDQRGFLTLDFAFAAVLVFALSAVLFALSFTFSVISITQYITFSAARVYYASHATEARQNELAVAKFEELKKDPVLGGFYANGWFELKNPEAGDFSDEDAEETVLRGDSLFHGFKVNLTAHLLNLKFPLFGSTSDEPLSTNVRSYMGRESSFAECKAFFAQRFEAITRLQNQNGQATYQQINLMLPPDGESVMLDNGC